MQTEMKIYEKNCLVRAPFCTILIISITLVYIGMIERVQNMFTVQLKAKFLL